MIAYILDSQKVPKKEDIVLYNPPIDDDISGISLKASNEKSNKKSGNKVVEGIKTVATNVKKALENKKCEKKEKKISHQMMMVCLT